MRRRWARDAQRALLLLLVALLPRAHAVWTLRGEVTGAANDDNFGESVAVSNDGTVIAVGTNNNYMRVYAWDGSSYAQRQNLNGEQSSGSESFGFTVALSSDGSILAVAGGSSVDAPSPPTSYKLRAASDKLQATDDKLQGKS